MDTRLRVATAWQANEHQLSGLVSIRVDSWLAYFGAREATRLRRATFAKAPASPGATARLEEESTTLGQAN